MDLEDIERTEIDEATTSSFTSEDQYMGLAVSLLIEAGSYICIGGNLYPADTKAWNRDQAVIGGHLVRLFKLIDALLDQTTKHRRETSFVFARLAFECVVNVRYLIANATREVFDSYRRHSLRHERRLLNTIHQNAERRGGNFLPIEQRMIKSIERSFRASGVSPDDATPSQRAWAGKNLIEKAQAVGLEQAYLAAFAGASHSVHGNWQDMLEYHLEQVEGDRFVANFDWHRPRPQVLEVTSLLGADVMLDYLGYIGVEDGPLVDRLHDLQERTVLLSNLHEEFLVRSGDA